jgi:hypothetical protein
MIDRPMWSGSASDLLQLCAQRQNPRALAGRLRRAQTFLRSLGIEVTFARQGRSGTRIIRVSTTAEKTVSTVSLVSATRANGAAHSNHP